VVNYSSKGTPRNAREQKGGLEKELRRRGILGKGGREGFTKGEGEEGLRATNWGKKRQPCREGR